MLFPSLEQVRRYAREANVVPVCRTVLADTETPVSVWMKLYRHAPYSFVLESVTGGDVVARYSFIGGDPFLRFSSNGDRWLVEGERREEGQGDPLGALRRLIESYRPAPVEGLPRFCGGAVGFFSYDSIRLWEEIPDKNPHDDMLDELFFGFYRDVVAFDNREHRLMLITNIFTETDGDPEGAYRQALGRLDAMQVRMKEHLANPRVRIGNAGEPGSNFRRPEYEDAVKACKEYILNGDIFQVVLSQRFSVDVEADPFDLYRILRTVNPSPYMYYLSCDQVQVIGASPEMLCRVEDDLVEVRPIAGTRPRGEGEHEDEVLARELRADPKEVAEHVMLVDLGRNDIGRVSRPGSVRVEEMLHIEKYSHVMHLVSNVVGEKKPECDALEAFFSCFPAGTLSGAPKIRAMEIIDELEPARRGLYGGALGYIDFSGNLDSCIVIRTIIYKNGTAYIQAGAGIVADSVPSREYEETVNKAKALFAAIRNAGQIAGD